MMLRSVGDCFTIARSFRAERSRTRRHQCEFDHAEAEMVITFEKLLDYIEEMVCYIAQFLLDHCGPIILQFNPDFKVPKRPFVRMTYHEAIKYCQEHGIQRPVPREEKLPEGVEVDDSKEDHEKPMDFVDVKENDDLVEFCERKIVDKIGAPVFLIKFRKCDKAFYVKACPEDPTLCQSADLLMPSVGETFGSGIREDNYEKIRAACVEHGLTGPQYDWFCELCKYGTVQTGGFGMGMQRFMCWVLKLDHIRSSTALERTIKRVSP